eukprot:2689498-Prymnesium_polylepis.1
MSQQITRRCRVSVRMIGARAGGLYEKPENESQSNTVAAAGASAPAALGAQRRSKSFGHNNHVPSLVHHLETTSPYRPHLEHENEEQRGGARRHTTINVRSYPPFLPGCHSGVNGAR